MAKKILIGIDLGGTNIKGAALDMKGEVICRERVRTDNDRGGAPAVLKRMSNLVKSLIAKAKATKGDVFAVGVGAPGPLNSKTGIITQTPNLGWRNIEVTRTLREDTKHRVFLENDAISAAYGEYWKGAAKGCRSMFILTLGTGVGGGIILDGEPLKGIDDSGSHLGHVPVEVGGRKCGCGAVGCLEAYASATGIVNRTRERLAKRHSCPTSPLRRIAPEALTAADVSAAAAKGCPIARSIIEETGLILGVAITGFANAFNPEVGVIGGGVAATGELLFAPIRQRVRQCALRAPGLRLKIVPAALGDDMGCVGAAGLAMHRRQSGEE